MTLVARLALAAAIVASAWILGRAMIHVFGIKHQEHQVAVTGSAKKRIRSDLIVWRATVSARATEPAAAYRKLADDVPKLVDLIRSKGVAAAEIVVGAVDTKELSARDKEGHPIPEQVVGYVMEQPVEVSSTDVERVAQVSREATSLMGQGMLIDSEAPKYLYTKLAELKIEMLAEASKDARLRAQQIATHTGGRLGRLNAARMGVMQINAANESEVSATGVNDTTSLDKDVMAIVTATFAIE
jgi:hypothetical protein